MRKKKNLKKITYRQSVSLIFKSSFSVNIGFQDEMRIGLIPCTKRVWSKVGERPICEHQNKYQWFYIYNVIFPFIKECFTLFLPTVNVDCVKLFWDEFLKIHKDKKYLIIWDQAGFHRGLNKQEYPNLKFLSLPPYSPELNPAETIWPVYREFIANKCFSNIKELEDELIKAYWFIERNKDEILSRTQFEWIMEISNV